ncbi:MAG TPA: hypothetical protein VN943_09050 [Candidatus Acidoferrum sp.]|nr:hypothetical protein [Candidatus Acidoferrum sp.]
MLLATMVLLGALPQNVDLVKSVANVSAVSVADAIKDSRAVRELPSMPKPKASADEVAGANSADAANSVVSASAAGPANAASLSAAAVQPPRVALAIQPVKPAYTRPRETRGQRIAWYTLAVTGHGAAAFDAYSTRRALSGNYGTEGNPLLRPFAHSGALYVATQASPALMDFLGKRMMVSENRWVRKMWWLPQAAGTGFSIGAGVHNMSVVK